MPKRTIQRSVIMKGNSSQANSHYNTAQQIENKRKLAAYIKTSLWDEKMNRKREFWLWERKNAKCPTAFLPESSEPQQ